jgi:hypothetical protein
MRRDAQWIVRRRRARRAPEEQQMLARRGLCSARWRRHRRGRGCPRARTDCAHEQ